MEAFYKKTFLSRSFSSFLSFFFLSPSFYLILGSGICVLLIAFSLSEKNFFSRSDLSLFDESMIGVSLSRKEAGKKNEERK